MAGSGGYLRNLVAQTGARLVFLFTTLGVFIAIARSMGPEAFGQYSYAVTFATLFATLADFGTGAILGRELTDRRGQDDREFWGAFLWLRAASAFGLVVPATSYPCSRRTSSTVSRQNGSSSTTSTRGISSPPAIGI